MICLTGFGTFEMRSSRPYQSAFLSTSNHLITIPNCLSESRRHFEDRDRETRREAYEALALARLKDGPEIEDLFDEMLALRGRIARNADCEDYRAYRFKELHRFDYAPDECATFHDAVERHAIPATGRFAEKRRHALGVETLRGYDFWVDTSGRPPLTPFEDQVGLTQLGSNLLVWANSVETSPVVAADLGDGAQAFENPGFRRLLGNALSWVSSAQARAWAQARRLDQAARRRS